jgi:hypothetical protein
MENFVASNTRLPAPNPGHYKGAELAIMVIFSIVNLKGLPAVVSLAAIGAIAVLGIVISMRR